MASFPASIKSFTTKTNGGTIDASHPNDLQDEVVAIETNLRGGSTGMVYVGSDPPAFSSVIAIHRVNSSQLSVSGASTLGTVQAGASTLATLSAGASTLATLQAGNSTITGNLAISGTLTVTGVLTNAGIPALLKGSTFATASTTIVDLSTFTSSFSQLDTLEIEYCINASTVAINNVRLRNKTDGVTVIDLNDQAGAGDFLATRRGVGVITVRQDPSAATTINAMNQLRTSANTQIQTGQGATYTTPWTDPIEYAIQGACSTTLGNLRGSWRVTHKKGQ